MRTLVAFFVSLVLLVSCCGENGDSKTCTQWGDSIAAIDNTTYYWLQFADDSTRISAVKDNKVAIECIVRGPVSGAKQYDNREICILYGQDYLHWFDLRNIPSEIDLMTEEEWENYDSSQENADAIIDIGK